MSVPETPRTALRRKEAEVAALHAKVAALEAQLKSNASLSPQPAGAAAVGAPATTATAGDGSDPRRPAPATPLPRSSLDSSLVPTPQGTPVPSRRGTPGDTGAASGVGGAGGAGAGAGAGSGGDAGGLPASSLSTPASRASDGGMSAATASPPLSRPTTSHPKGQTAEHVFLTKVRKNMAGLQTGRKPAVLVCTGSFNPVHLQHARIFYIARQFMQDKYGYQIVGGLMAPSHDSAVRLERRMQPAHAIPAYHRVNMCELAVDRSSWLAVDRWAVTRNLVMDYPSVLRNVQQLLRAAFPGGKEPQVMFLCGADQLVKSIGRMTFTCVCVARPGYMDELRRAVTKKHRALTHVVDDDSILTTALDTVSSTKVRKRLVASKGVEEMVGTVVWRYIEKHGLAAKIAGKSKWSGRDKQAVVSHYSTSAAAQRKQKHEGRAARDARPARGRRR